MEKKLENYILYVLIVLALGLLAYLIFPSPEGSAEKVVPSPGPALPFGEFLSTITTGSTSQGDVSIELTPEKPKGGQLKVRVAANTHSVDLSPFDLKEITALEYNGKKVGPASASSLSGHHAQGELVFAVEEGIKDFKIVIRGIPLEENRVFEWKS